MGSYYWPDWDYLLWWDVHVVFVFLHLVILKFGVCIMLGFLAFSHTARIRGIKPYAFRDKKSIGLPSSDLRKINITGS